MKELISQIKSTVKNFCPPILWVFLKKIIIKKKYYGTNKLDKKIEPHINFNNGFFVELGANDGINHSNTYFFEKYREWRGILIEPIPQKYLECVKNRSNRNKIFCNACVSFKYKKKFVEMIYSDLMTTSVKLENDIKNPNNHAKKGEKFLKEKEHIFSFGSISKTLNEILLKAKAPKKIDFLSLDVEGAEIEVLKGVNHKRYRFKLICVESRSFNKLNNYLIKNNYLFHEKLSTHDYLFKDKDKD
jgi:FkbM family methyltransferase